MNLSEARLFYLSLSLLTALVDAEWAVKGKDNSPPRTDKPETDKCDAGAVLDREIKSIPDVGGISTDNEPMDTTPTDVGISNKDSVNSI